jgi:hypothetical protein
MKDLNRKIKILKDQEINQPKRKDNLLNHLQIFLKMMIKRLLNNFTR